MSIGFILCQIFGAISMFIEWISYSFKSKNIFLIMRLLSNLFFVLSMIVQGLIVAGLNTFVSTIGILIFYLYMHYKKAIPKWWILIFEFIYVAITIIFFKTAWDLVPLFTSSTFLICYYVKDMQKTRLISLIPNTAITLYSFIFQAYVNALSCFINIIISICSFIYYKKSTNKPSMNKLAQNETLTENMHKQECEK